MEQLINSEPGSNDVSDLASIDADGANSLLL